MTHRGGGSGVEIQVVVKLETLLGLSEDPAVVAGMGPIPAGIARELAADGKWRAWITNTAGTIVTTSSRGYTPSAGLARLIRAREPYCRMPGCQRPATKCDLDHAVPWPQGRTTAENLGPLCRRHHNLKTHHGWKLDLVPPNPPPGPSPGPPSTPTPGPPTSTRVASPGPPDSGTPPSAKPSQLGARTSPTPDPWTQPPEWTWTTPTGKTLRNGQNPPDEAQYPF